METTTHHDADSIPAFRPDGAIDITNSGSLRDDMLQHVESGARALVLDLSDVRYVDSSGLSVLVNVATALERQRGKLVLCHVDGAVMKVLEMTRLTEYFVLADDRAAAMERAAEIQAG